MMHFDKVGCHVVCPPLRPTGHQSMLVNVGAPSRVCTDTVSYLFHL